MLSADGAASSAAATTLRGPEKRGIEELAFGPFEGTQKECDRLVNAFQGWHWQAEAFTGSEATKAARGQVHSPYLLHLATYGFFEPGDQPDAELREQHLMSVDNDE